jgi:hypothetical protein
LCLSFLHSLCCVFSITCSCFFLAFVARHSFSANFPETLELKPVCVFRSSKLRFVRLLNSRFQNIQLLLLLPTSHHHSFPLNSDIPAKQEEANKYVPFVLYQKRALHTQIRHLVTARKKKESEKKRLAFFCFRSYLFLPRHCLLIQKKIQLKIQTISSVSNSFSLILLSSISFFIFDRFKKRYS